MGKAVYHKKLRAADFLEGAQSFMFLRQLNFSSTGLIHEILRTCDGADDEHSKHSQLLNVPNLLHGSIQLIESATPASLTL